MKNNNRGFTLVEIMIAAAMLGGLSLALMQLNKGSLQTQGDAVSMADYVQLQKEIGFIISDGNSCTASLGSTLGPPIVTGVTFNGLTIKNTPITGLELWSSNQTTPPVRSRKRFYETQKFGKVVIGSISFSMPDYTAGINFLTGTNQSFKGELKISGSKLNMGKTKTFPDIIQSINVTFDTNAAGLSTIKSCSLANNLSPTATELSSCATGGGGGGGLSRGAVACTNGTNYRICGCSADWGNCNCKTGIFSTSGSGKPSCAVSGGGGGLSRGAVACTNGKSLLTCNCSADWNPNCSCSEDANAFDSDAICSGKASGNGDSLSRPTIVCSSAKKVIAMMFSADWVMPKKTAISYPVSDTTIPSCSVSSEGAGSDLTRPIIACTNSKSNVLCHCSADWSPACNCSTYNY